MTKQNKKISFILLVLLYLNPFIDLITSLSLNVFKINLSIGMVVRTLTLLILSIYIIFTYKKRLKQNIIYFFAIVIYLLSYIALTISLKGSNVIITELQNIFKIFYFPLLLVCLTNLDIDFSYKHYVYVSGIYMLLIFIPLILNLSFPAYTQGKVGVIGWFNSANEISAILSISSIYLVRYLFSKEKILNKIILALLTIVVFLSLGSKLPLISLILSFGYYLGRKLKNKELKISYKILIPSIILIFALGVIILPKTSMFKNIEIHLDYLEIDSIEDVFSFKFLNRFIFSDRLTYLENTKETYNNSSSLEKIFGIGYTHNGAEDKVIEMDFYDIFYRSGILGFILFLISWFIWLKTIKKKNISKFNIILAIIIAFLSGHVLTAPSVSFNLGVIMNNRSKEEQL